MIVCTAVTTLLLLASCADLRHDVLHEILHPDQYSGTSMQSFPLLSSLIKGFRRGELSVLTGGTGAGKTTLLTQVSSSLLSHSFI